MLWKTGTSLITAATAAASIRRSQAQRSAPHQGLVTAGSIVRSWMIWVNACYHTRPMNTGEADVGVNVSNKHSVFFQQIAFNAEAVSDSCNFNAYALVLVGDISHQLNSIYRGGGLDTYGLDVGYFVTPEVIASIGYYYQHGRFVSDSGVLGRSAYEISSGVTAAVNISYDEAFNTRVSTDLKV